MTPTTNAPDSNDRTLTTEELDLVNGGQQGLSPILAKIKALIRPLLS